MRYLTLFLALVLTGCATIVTGTSTDVAIQSDPQEAEIKINGQDYGDTPKTVTLDSDRSHTVELQLEGYETETVQFRKSTSGWLAGNILLGGIPGLIIDVASGGMYVLSPKQLNADLDETETSAQKNKLTIRVAMNLEDDLKEEKLHKVGQLNVSE